MELQHVPTDQQVTDTFTKPLGLDMLRHFLSRLGLQQLNMLNLRGRSEARKMERDDVREAESDEEFNFGTTEKVSGTSGSAEEAEDTSDMKTSGRGATKWRSTRYTRNSRRKELELEPTKQGGVRAEKAKIGSRAKNGGADLKVKAKTSTWSNVVKSLKDDESETINLEESNHMKARRMRGQPKPTLK